LGHGARRNTAVQNTEYEAIVPSSSDWRTVLIAYSGGGILGVVLDGCLVR